MMKKREYGTLLKIHISCLNHDKYTESIMKSLIKDQTIENIWIFRNFGRY